MLSAKVRLIGRDAEFNHITSALNESASAAVVIAGRAGVGKSRLAEEVAGTASATGRPVAHVVATQGAAAMPFGAFASLLPDMANLPSHPVELIKTFAESIAGRALDGRPLLLVVDDAHFLDAGSASLVHQLVLTRSCGVVMTVRTPDVAPDPIVGLWKDGMASRVEIQELSRWETDALVTSYLGGPVGGPALRWLWDVSAGNPLFVRELLIGAQETGSAYLQDGIWFLRLPMPAPPRLNDLIASRLSNMPAVTEQVVDLLAIGEPLDLADLVEIAGHEAVEDAENRGLITVGGGLDGTDVRMSHPLYREVVNQRIPRARLRRLSARLADTIEAHGSPRRGDILRVARWRLDSGAAADPELLEKAARLARAARDLPLAARFARASLSAGGGVRAGLSLGETEFMDGRPHEAETVFAEMVPLCRTDDERSMIANARAYNFGVLLGDEQAASAVIEEALSTIVDPVARNRLLVNQAINHVYSGRLAAAISVSDELAESPNESAVRRGLYVRSVALALLGRTREAVETGYGALDQHRRRLKEDPDLLEVEVHPPEVQLLGPIMGHIVGGGLATAESDARLGSEVALDRDDRESLATFSLMLGWLLVERGLVRDAARSFREAAALNRELSDTATLRWCLGGVTLAEALSGNLGAAIEAEAELSAIPAHWFAVLDPLLVHRGRAWLLIVSGELTAARTHLTETAETARADQHFAAEAVLLHDLVRIGEARTVATRLAELSEIVDGELVPAFAAHASARLTGIPAALEAAATGFEKIGAMLLAAEAAHAGALAYTSDGKARPANALSRKSAALYEVCGARRIPWAAEVDSAVALTRRELEIALLAAPGMTNKAVADRLCVSVRTVENHLQRVYTKLGISNRNQLAEGLRDAGVG